MTEEAIDRCDCIGLACLSKDWRELDRWRMVEEGSPVWPPVAPPALSWSIEEKVGLKEELDAPIALEIGGLANFPPKELDVVVSVAPRPGPPGFSLSCLFKYAMYSPLDFRLS